jgi:hypothetical protein
MATIYSDQLVNWRAGRRQQANVFQGKHRVIFWDFASLPAGNIADVLVCGKIRKGERVMMGREAHSALSSGAGTATASYGTYAILADGQSLGAADDNDRFLVATSFEAAGATLIADSIAHFLGFEATVDVFLVCVNSVEAFATAGRVTGELPVVG